MQVLQIKVLYKLFRHVQMRLSMKKLQREVVVLLLGLCPTTSGEVDDLKGLCYREWSTTREVVVARGNLTTTTEVWRRMRDNEHAADKSQSLAIQRVWRLSL